MKIKFEMNDADILEIEVGDEVGEKLDAFLERNDWEKDSDRVERNELSLYIRTKKYFLGLNANDEQ